MSDKTAEELAIEEEDRIVTEMIDEILKEKPKKPEDTYDKVKRSLGW